MAMLGSGQSKLTDLSWFGRWGSWRGILPEGVGVFAEESVGRMHLGKRKDTFNFQ